MRPRLTAAACVLLTVLPVAPRVQPLDANRRWWHIAEMQRQLHLSRAQVGALDTLFERGLPERIALHRQIEELDRRLARTMEGDNASEGGITRLSQQVEALRARQKVRRTLMLFAMYQTLTHDQRQRLAQMHRSGQRAAPHEPHSRDSSR